MITLLIITLIMSFLHASTTEQTTGPVTYCKYRESGMRYNHEYIFELKKDGTATLTRTKNWRDKGETVTVPASVGDELWQLADRHKMYKYKDSYSPIGRILDGVMWHLEMNFTTGKELYTGGDNAWPNGGGINELDKYLQGIWEQYRPYIKLFSYRLEETMVNPTYYFLVERDEEGKFWFTNGSECDREDARKVELSNYEVEELWDIIEEAGMRKYKRDYEPKFRIYDGYMWVLHATFSDGSPSIYSSGYNAMPDGDGIKRMVDFFTRTWNHLKEKSIPAPIETYK